MKIVRIGDFFKREGKSKGPVTISKVYRYTPHNHRRRGCSNARPDHVHCLLSLPPALAVAEGLRVIESNSSLGVHETGHGAAFAWQAGYGAFSVSPSNVPAVVKYIRDQEQHHRTISLQEEFIVFLKAHRIPYDERYIQE
jgi:hypothetical protein